ncbi:MAG: thiamine pyrophosphate-binding protein [Betaproteobacteria bacterium]|nr:thiamine pyrophosphate-binding protein [Betaproteobacteria bacterium]
MNSPDPTSKSIVHDAPVASRPGETFWGSDVVALMLRELDIPYISLVPGASYRGLHDSIVNYLGNRAPQMVLCVHEETAVGIAHGYAKVTDKIMAAGLHANIGLMRAIMSIYNAWCDRAPMLIMGASGPWDATQRRPWIDWIHTSSDQGGLIRNFTKWDNQPGSPVAAAEALLRATQIAQTAPKGPTYVNLDVSLQESQLGPMPALPDPSRNVPPRSPQPAPELVAQAAKLLSEAKAPVILMGRCSRSLDGWNARVALAEKLNAPVCTNVKLAAAFPTDHPLHASAPGSYLTDEARAMVREADVVLSLDFLDLAGTLKQAFGDKPIIAKVIQVSCDQHNHRGGGADHFGLPPMDVYLMCETDAAVPLLLNAVTARSTPPRMPPVPALPDPPNAVSLRGVGIALEQATRGVDVCYTRFPLGWNGAYTHFRHPLDYIGHDGGAGVGSGPPMTVGAGLALKGSGRIAIGLCGDGDFLMGNTAVWTAVHYQIPCLMIVCNNRSFYNDERHQGNMAKHRGRPVENRWIGQRIDDPPVDIAAMARSQGALGIGPVEKPEDVLAAIEQGIAAVRAGGVCVIDMHVLPGYDTRA